MRDRAEAAEGCQIMLQGQRAALKGDRREEPLSAVRSARPNDSSPAPNHFLLRALRAPISRRTTQDPPQPLISDKHNYLSVGACGSDRQSTAYATATETPGASRHLLGFANYAGARERCKQKSRDRQVIAKSHLKLGGSSLGSALGVQEFHNRKWSAGTSGKPVRSALRAGRRRARSRPAQDVFLPAPVPLQILPAPPSASPGTHRPHGPKERRETPTAGDVPGTQTVGSFPHPASAASNPALIRERRQRVPSEIERGWMLIRPVKSLGLLCTAQSNSHRFWRLPRGLRSGIWKAASGRRHPPILPLNGRVSSARVRRCPLHAFITRGVKTGSARQSAERCAPLAPMLTPEIRNAFGVQAMSSVDQLAPAAGSGQSPTTLLTAAVPFPISRSESAYLAVSKEKVHKHSGVGESDSSGPDPRPRKAETGHRQKVRPLQRFKDPRIHRGVDMAITCTARRLSQTLAESRLGLYPGLPGRPSDARARERTCQPRRGVYRFAFARGESHWSVQLRA
ncbi:hypothetical protein SKAU_G00349140 [Synaphobranchus kaupii]|uniref:Uncharacterized protein n=1 Tax=Synaphobranchus kaupii TaxID=118154 RepID=A0A9Q1EK45_SYNKA|nr:hypothetical protein SKAU_G00349140 [Synaphobranchus kaupii]